MRVLQPAELDQLLTLTLERLARYQRAPVAGNEVAIRQLAVNAQTILDEQKRRGWDAPFMRLDVLTTADEGDESDHEHPTRSRTAGAAARQPRSA